MNEVQELRAEREKINEGYTLFLSEYKATNTSICYGFVEGKTDPSFYRCHINKELPTGYNIKLYAVGSKQNVKKTFDLIKREGFLDDQIVFLMDRDLSDIIEDLNIVNSRNVYITDKYSIENSVVNADTLELTLRDIMGFCNTEQKSIDTIIALFNQQLHRFEESMLFIMANIVLWRKLKIPANLNQLNIDRLISITNGYLEIKITEGKVKEQIYAECQVSEDVYNEEDIFQIKSEIENKNLKSSIVRGKYLVPFFIKFCNSIFNDCGKMKINKTHKGEPLNKGDFMKSIAPRCRIPVSLKKFIENTVLNYISTQVAL